MDTEGGVRGKCEGERADQPRWEERGREKSGKGVIRYALRSSNGRQISGRGKRKRGLSHAHLLFLLSQKFACWPSDPNGFLPLFNPNRPRGGNFMPFPYPNDLL